MSSSRRRSPSPPRRASDSRSPSPVNDFDLPRSRRSSRSSGREVRISTSGPGSGGSVIKASSRTRRPTPIVKRAGGGYRDEDDDESTSDSGQEHGHNHHVHHGHQHNSRSRQGARHVSIRTETSGGPGGRRSRHLNLSASAGGRGHDQLAWYERMVPEFLLGATSSLTGYERAPAPEDLDELDERDRQLLDRDRLRRNKRARRRVFYVLLAASLASAYFVWRGRFPGRRPPGVRGAINSMAQRLEDGLAKTYQDTMGK